MNGPRPTNAARCSPNQPEIAPRGDTLAPTGAGGTTMPPLGKWLPSRPGAPVPQNPRTTTVLPIGGWMTYRAAYTQQRGGAPRALPSANTTWLQKGGASEWYVSEPAASPAQKCSRHVSGWAGSPTRCWAPRFPSPSFTFARNPQSFLVVRFPRQCRRAPDGPGLKQNMCPTFCLEA